MGLVVRTSVAAMLVALVMVVSGCGSQPRASELAPPSAARVASFRAALVPPPEGFEWAVFENVLVAVLKPEGWHRIDSPSGRNFTGSLSVENVQTQGSYKTGFSAMVYRDVKKTTGRPPSVAGRMTVEELRSKQEILEESPFVDHGWMRSAYLRFRDRPVNGNDIIVHTFFVARDDADMLYMFTFESPTAQWDEAFGTYGKPMMEKLLIGR